MASQAERRSTTRSALITAARACFLELGFDGASTDSVLARASLSKGALYHHFSSKTDLFAAVFAAVARETLAEAQAASRELADPRAALIAGFKAWLRAALKPEPLSILLRMGPAALGVARARAIEDQITLEPVRRLVARANQGGPATRVAPDLAARIMNVAVGEMALVAAERDVTGALEGFDEAIERLVAALVP